VNRGSKAASGAEGKIENRSEPRFLTHFNHNPGWLHVLSVAAANALHHIPPQVLARFCRFLLGVAPTNSAGG
jgi:hypothetical protein